MTRDYDAFRDSKRAFEEDDRVRMLADDARRLLAGDQYSPYWPAETSIKFLMERGSFSWGEAKTALDFIDWEDKHASKPQV
jgi:hypothetical protein